ncbi:hypothetical protein [Nocardioides terrae]|uniref:hypothetical protein n=1 Tax=Nocardioides terrae TaxID=574651 RepID=UPI000B89C6D8|nr:hypothetical protein [Nocardioides terrae]
MSRATAWVAGLVAGFAATGAVSGLLWRTRLHAPDGIVVGGQWYSGSTHEDSFASTGWYVVIAVAAGLLLGIAAAWLSRAPEVLTLAAVLVGSLLAAWLMRVVGLHGAPPDPARAAAHAADGTRLTGTISRPGVAAFVTWPLAAVLAVGAVFLLLGERPTGEEPR